MDDPLVHRSTLLSSPLSMADFVLRLVFFASAPVAIVFAAELFPVRGALIDVGLALGLFIAGEAVQRWAAKTRLVKSYLSGALAFEAYYRSRPPRPFIYYLAYPSAISRIGFSIATLAANSFCFAGTR